MRLQDTHLVMEQVGGKGGEMELEYLIRCATMLFGGSRLCVSDLALAGCGLSAGLQLGYLLLVAHAPTCLHSLLK